VKSAKDLVVAYKDLTAILSGEELERRMAEVTEKYQTMINSFKEGKKDLTDMD